MNNKKSPAVHHNARGYHRGTTATTRRFTTIITLNGVDRKCCLWLPNARETLLFLAMAAFFFLLLLGIGQLEIAMGVAR